MRAAKFFRSLFTGEAKPRRSHSVRLGLDNLERRDVPSGTVTGALSRNGKTWTITGDDQANDITINPTGNGSFTLTGNDTTVSGATDVSGVENITIKMGEGDDSVSVMGIDTNSTLAGHLKIDGGNGANSAIVMDMTISKNLIVKNGTNASGQDQNSITDTSVNGKVQIANGDGDTLNTLGTTTIGGSLRIMNGSGYDYNQVLDTNINGNVLVRNGLPNRANHAGNTQILSYYNPSQPSIIGGNITVSYDGGANPDEFDRDILWDYDVQGNVAYNYKQGSGQVSFDGTDEPAMIHGNLSIKGTGGILVHNNYGQGLWVGGKLTIISGGAATDILLFYHLTVDGKTTIKTGDSIDTVIIDDCMFAAFNLNTNKGNDRVEFDLWGGGPGATTFMGKVKVNLGMGDDQMMLGDLGDSMLVEFGDVTRIFGDDGNDTISEGDFVALNGDPITILA